MRKETVKSAAIVSINYAPEVTGIGVYTAGLAEHLAMCDYAVTVYTAFPYYPAWEKCAGDQGALLRKERAGNVDLRRSYVYVPKHLSVFRRVAHELSFAASACVSYLMGPRAALTLIVSPPLFLGIPLALLARLKGSRVLLHVQDMQPDAALDLEMLRPGAVANILFAIERLTYRLAHGVSAISANMLRKIEGKGVPARKLVLLRNWANDDIVLPGARDTPYRRDWELAGKFVVLYSGNMGVKQGLHVLIEAAQLLRLENDVVFLIVGDGGQKEDLMQRARALSLENIVFERLQPVEALSSLLATADVSVIPQKPGAGDTVLPSKLANLMASARPVVAMAEPETELHRAVTQAQCGKVVAPGDARGLAQALLELKASGLECHQLGENGRAYMKRYLSGTSVLGGFEVWLSQWMEKHSGTRARAWQE
jgi:colanic acid biosynthesis glycosyl transferase WcaI